MRDILTIGAVLLLAACAQPVKETPVANSLPPMPEPVLDIGYGFVSLRDDQTEQVTKIVAQSDTERTWQVGNGCRWTIPRGQGFAPTIKWENCENPDGTQTVIPLRHE